MTKLTFVMWLCVAVAHVPSAVFAAEASTHFSVFVPPNNDNRGRDSVLTITAVANSTSVTATDTDEDGDNDDSTSAVLSKGQSLIIAIKEGDVNDDAPGKWDGDRIIVDADKPVIGMLSTKSSWQYDWAPSIGGTMRGTEFFVWSQVNNWDVDAVAYEDDTTVEIYRVSSVARESTGTTDVSLPGELLMRQTIDEGQSLIVDRGEASRDLADAGQTYRVISDKPVTLMFGALRGRERDGGGYVPSEGGTTMGQKFYVPLPATVGSERELRIATGPAAASVEVRGRRANQPWTTIESFNLRPILTPDITGRENSLVAGYEIFEVTSTQPVNVFGANWLESGNTGTSDYMTFVSALDGNSASDVGVSLSVTWGLLVFRRMFQVLVHDLHIFTSRVSSLV